MLFDLAKDPGARRQRFQLCALRRAIVFLALLVMPLHAWTQENQSQPIEETVLAMMNQLRAKAGLHVLKTDKQLNDTASLHASEVLQNNRVADQFEGEPSLLERLRLAHIPCASAGEIVLSVENLSEAFDQLSGNEKDAVLNPKFSQAGVAVMTSGSRLVIVVNLIRPLQELSADEVEQFVADAVQRMRADQRLVPLKVIPMRRLRGIACDMSKKDSIKATAINPYADYIGAPTESTRNFTYTSFDPGIIPANVQHANGDPKINVLSVGACFAASHTYPDGTYWIYLILYGK